MTFALAAGMHTGKSRTKGGCTVRAYIQKVNKSRASPTQDKEAAYHTVFSGEAFFLLILLDPWPSTSGRACSEITPCRIIVNKHTENSGD